MYSYCIFSFCSFKWYVEGLFINMGKWCYFYSDIDNLVNEGILLYVYIVRVWGVLGYFIYNDLLRFLWDWMLYSMYFFDYEI